MTARYCVIGNPIGHSKSPAIHAAFARQCGQDIEYQRCLAPLDGFAATVQQLVADGFRGANVTVPFKLDAAALCATLSARADAAGAVNTLVFADGAIAGDNTDGAGLSAISSATPALPWPASACCCWARAGQRAAPSCRCWASSHANW